MTYPMVEDPAATLAPSAYSEQATAALERIVATPRHEPAATRRPASPKRIAVGGLIAAAAVTVALAAPMIWNGGSSEAAAYTVARHSDASVSVVVHWNQLSDPNSLQRALDRAGAPVRVLTGPVGSAGGSPTDIPGCARPYYGRAYSSDAVSWDSGRNAPDSSFVVHPAAFPQDGTLVIEVFFVPGSHQWASMLSFMAVGRVPTCAVSVGTSR